jgi:hypothetical protein
VKAILRALPYLLLTVVLSGLVISMVGTNTPQAPTWKPAAVVQSIDPTPTPRPTPPPTHNECEHIFCG